MAVFVFSLIFRLETSMIRYLFLVGDIYAIYTGYQTLSKLEDKLPKKVVKNIMAVSIPISLSSIISAINKNIDAITVVRGLKTFLSESVAKVQYGILSGKVDTLIGLPLSFNIAFATALVPAVSSSIATGDKESITKRVS